MAEIRNFYLVRHIRAERSSFMLAYRGGALRRSGRGLSFWYLPLSTSIAEVPVDDRELPFLFHARSSDYQDVTAQGAITYRVADAKLLADRVNFSLDLETGDWVEQPLDTLASLFIGLAQELAIGTIATRPVRELLAEGVERVREAVHGGLASDAGVGEMGLEVVNVRVSAVQPTSELGRALEAPTRELIQQSADDATFERRARAVEKERAIQENELQNRIELARREQELIRQTGQNELRRAEEDAAAKKLAAEAAADRVRIGSAGEAERIRVVEQARVESDSARMDIYRTLPPTILYGLAAQELARKLERIDHLNISPDMFGPVLLDLVQAGTAKLEAKK